MVSLTLLLMDGGIQQQIVLRVVGQICSSKPTLTPTAVFDIGWRFRSYIVY